MITNRKVYILAVLVNIKKNLKGELEMKSLTNKRQDSITKLVEKNTGLTVEKQPKKLLYKGIKETKLKDYLDSNPTYHNWSRSCDVGH